MARAVYISIMGIKKDVYMAPYYGHCQRGLYSYYYGHDRGVNIAIMGMTMSLYSQYYGHGQKCLYYRQYYGLR
jgi:hypothetical protein